MGEAKQDLGRELDAPLRRRLGGISGVMRDWGEGGKSRWAAKRGMEALEFLLAGPSHNRWWMGTQQQRAAAATAASRACLNFRVRWGRVSMMV